MALTKYKLGELISLVDERNSNNSFGADYVVGLGTQKEIIPTKADLDGVSLTSYKLFPPKSFAYVPVTSRNGEKITIAPNTTKQTYIVSASYLVFKVQREDILLPDYLFIYFNRAEFDRYARFHSWGSARELFSRQDLTEVEIPIPALEVQRSIAAVYEVYRTRQKILEQLKEQLKKICPILIKGSLDEGAAT